MKLSEVRRIPRDTPVAVQWLDALARFDWEPDKVPGCINKSYGEIVDVKNDFIIMAGEVEGVLPSGQGPRSITEIPISLVLEVTLLKEGKVYGTKKT